jgi:hypothetical protein
MKRTEPLVIAVVTPEESAALGRAHSAHKHGKPLSPGDQAIVDAVRQRLKEE